MSKDNEDIENTETKDLRNVGNDTSIDIDTTVGPSEEDEEDDEEEEPPKLKYTKISQLPINFFNKDPISTCSFHESIFIFATHSGIIHITKPDYSSIRTFKAHRASVLSIYTDGKYFASGSMDGTIVIGSIKDEKDIIAYDFKRPIHSVVLDRNYSKNRSFISGGMSGKVIYSTKNWLGQRSDLVLDEGNGPIVSIQLVDDLVIWMNDKGITVYHLSTRQVISTIDKPEDSPRSDLYWPRVSFPEVDRILIGWGNYIWSLRVSIKNDETQNKILPSTATISFRSAQEKNVQIERVFKLDCLISGISSFKDDLWMILTYEQPTIGDDDRPIFHYPELKLINQITGEVEFEEEIGLKNIDNLGLNDYLLGSYIHKIPKYFIISAKYGVTVEEFQLIDRLNWFIERERYYEAWDISQHLISPTKRLNLGLQYVDNLIKENEWDKATEFLSKLLHINENELPDADTKSTLLTTRSTSSEDHENYIIEIVKQWETWSNIFIKTSHIKELTNILPMTTKLNLPKDIYDEILEYWLNEDQKIFYSLIENWDNDLYDIKRVQSTLEEFLEVDSSNLKLRECLSNLYVKSYEPQKSVPHLIALREPNLIHFLSNHHLLNNFIKELPTIISLRFNENEINTLPIDKLNSRLKDVIDTLVENRHELLPKDLINLFFENHLDFINFFYLEELNKIDDYSTLPFGNERIKLYASYKRSLLLPFLTKNSNYDIDEAIKLCESNEYTEELVYLLGKIGENKKALMLIINKLNDPEKAIKFAKHQNDKDAWSILLDYSMEKPPFIKALIECADDQSNSFYDPISILKRMPKNIRITGLSKSVIKFSNNNDLNLILNQLVLKIIYKQSEEIFNLFRYEKLKGFEINIDDLKNNYLIENFQTILVLTVNNTIHYRSEFEFLNEKFEKSFTTLKEKVYHLKLLREKLNADTFCL